MRVVPVFMAYDYGIKTRGESLEVRGFIPALEEIADEIHPFWYDDYLNDKPQLQKKLIEHVDQIKPDVVFFILMRDEVSIETLDYLKDRYVTVNWFGDDQWRFDDFTRKYAPHFTFSVTTDKYSLRKYQEIGYPNVILSQWASFAGKDDVDFDTIHYNYDVSFVGGISAQRKWIIDELLKRGIRVDCFGQGWKNGRVSFEEIMEIFKTSKINLNMSNSVPTDIRYILSSLRNVRNIINISKSLKKAEQIKARNFEIPLLGGFQLSNYVPSLEDYFRIGEDITIYTSIDDLALQIRYYLENEGERKEIMVNGHKASINNHLYVNRLQEIFQRMSIL